MPSWSGTLSGTTHAMTPVTTAAAPTQMRKKPGATISAAASSTPSDSHAQCGSMLASQRSEERRVGKECDSQCRSRWKENDEEKQTESTHIHIVYLYATSTSSS